MAVEHEAKVLDIDPTTMDSLIRHRGGKKVAERLMRRYVYDVEPGNDAKWIRLRDDGTEVSLTTKEILHDGIDGTLEQEVVVGDFEATNLLLESLGFKAKAYQESRRESYELEGAQIEIDTWPLIPTYMEIEARSKAEVIRIASLLGYREDDLTGENTTKVYARYGVDLASISDLRF